MCLYDIDLIVWLLWLDVVITLQSTHAYQMQLQMLQEMAGTMSEEELGAIRLALSEAGMIAPPQPRQARQRNRTEGEGDEGDEEADEGTYDDEEGDEEEEEASQEWSYEQLLELGERLGKCAQQ